MSGEVKFFIGTIAATILVVLGGLLLFGFQNSPDRTPLASPEFLVREDSFQTNPGAQVALVEFSDLECPACRAAQPVVEQVLAEYGERVNFVYRHFPLPQHGNAVVSGQAAEAAGRQGKFLEMVSILFANQTTWAASREPAAIFQGYAEGLGLDIEQFLADMEDENFKKKIEADRQDGQLSGVNSTPTFFVNGVKMAGAPSYAQLKAAIDTALNSPE